MREILFVVGEASGDLHAAKVVAALRDLAPETPVRAVGGDLMRTAGAELLEHAQHLAVLGAVEVLAQIPRHYRLLRRLKARIRSGSVGLLVLVDYPGFNMKLAAAAARAKVPVLYYITPQVWAWGAGRLTRLASTVTKAAVILPFEEELLRANGVDATFVGHPLLDSIEEMPDRASARASLGLREDDAVLALFPGSREQEIRRHLGDFVSAARELERRRSGLRVIVSVAPTVSIDPASCPYPMVRSASLTVLRAADAALCKSGTTTLQAAVAGCPLVVAYRTSRITYALARRLVRIEFVGLVNLVAGREVAPEFVQHALQPQALADALEPLLERGSPVRSAMTTALHEVRARLGTPGASARVARLALGLAR